MQQADRLQWLAQIMAGGGKESRLAEIGLLGLPLGGFQRRGRLPAFGDVVDRQQDLASPRRPIANFAGIQQQEPAPELRELDLDLVILDRSGLGADPIEEAAQPRNFRVAIVGQPHHLADGFLGVEREILVEGPVGGNDPQFLVEHDQRLADRVDDAVGIGARRPDLALGRLYLGDVGEGDDHPVDPVVLGAVGRMRRTVPGAAIGFDLARQWRKAGRARRRRRRADRGRRRAA